MTPQQYKFKAYYLTAIFSLLFAVVGFSYNAWRMEVTEDNSNIRTAAFEVLTELAELQQLVYAAHYDHDTVSGNPRNGWVKVGLIVDLSVLISNSVVEKTLILQNTWADNWDKIQQNTGSANKMISDIEMVRMAIKQTLQNLR